MRVSGENILLKLSSDVQCLGEKLGLYSISSSALYFLQGFMNFVLLWAYFICFLHRCMAALVLFIAWGLISASMSSMLDACTLLSWKSSCTASSGVQLGAIVRKWKNFTIETPLDSVILVQLNRKVRSDKLPKEQRRL